MISKTLITSGVFLVYLFICLSLAWNISSYYIPSA